MTNKGPNRGAGKERTDAGRERTEKDAAVRRDPDIRGVNKGSRETEEKGR